MRKRPAIVGILVVLLILPGWAAAAPKRRAGAPKAKSATTGAMPAVADLEYVKALVPSLDLDLDDLATVEALNLSRASNGEVAKDITDAGLARLQGVAHLETLDLIGTGITDAGLAHLKALDSLTQLNIDETKVTEL